MQPSIFRASPRVLSALLAALAALPVLAETAPQPSRHLPLGLFDAGHTFGGDPAGWRVSLLSARTSTGFAGGLAARPDTNGESVWLADLWRGSVFRAGLFDSEHSSDIGAQTSALGLLAGSGWSIGSSTRYLGGSSSRGQSAWLADANTGAIHRVGLLDVEFTSAAGAQTSVAQQIFDRYAIGYSTRYSGTSVAGYTPWAVSLTNPAQTIRLGLNDAEHTRANGYQSHAYLFGGDGLDHVAGASYRYDGGSAGLGQTTWVTDLATGATTRIGFFDTAHTFSAPGLFGEAVGTRYSVLVAQGSGGWIGQSALDGAAFGENTGIGNFTAYTAWYYSPDDGETRRIGLEGADYVAVGGRHSSRVVTISGDGLVLGFTQRFSGDGLNGSGREERWVLDLATDAYTQVGLRDAEHRRADGVISHGDIGGARATSDGFASTNANTSRFTTSGLLLGSTEQWNGVSMAVGVTYFEGADYGTSPWIYDAATGQTTRIGLTDAEHTRANGVRSSQIRHVFTQASPTSISEQGYVGGHANRYSGGSAQLGRSAWIASAATGLTQRVGLFGPEQTRADGFQESTLTHLTANGYGAGVSRRYQGAESLGQNLWLADGATGETRQIGLRDAAHTSPGLIFNPAGEQYSEIVAINSLGQAAGNSMRYSASSDAGYSAWAADFASGETTRIGLFDTRHSSASGIQNSYVAGLGESGLAWGYSIRYDGENTAGQTAWIYDVATATQTDFTISVRTGDGYAFSQIDAINAQGLALGHYTYFDSATSADLGYRPFLWSVELGLIDLKDSVTGSALQSWTEYFPDQSRLLDSGWIILAIAPDAAAAGSLGQLALRYEAVPEPAACGALLGLAALASALGHRRRKA